MNDWEDVIERACRNLCALFSAPFGSGVESFAPTSRSILPLGFPLKSGGVFFAFATRHWSPGSAEPPKEKIARVEHAERFFANTGAKIEYGGNRGVLRHHHRHRRPAKPLYWWNGRGSQP